MTRDIATWNTSAPKNNFDVPDGAPERHARNQVNDIKREHMSRIAQMYQDGLEWLDLLRDPDDRSLPYTVTKTGTTTFTVTSGDVDLSSLFNVDRRLQMTTAGAPTDFLHVDSVLHSAPNTTVTVRGALTDGIDGCLLMSISTLGALAFLDVSPGLSYFLTATVDEEGFSDALAAAAASTGGTVLLSAGTYELTTGYTIPSNVRLLGMGAGLSTLQWSGEGGVSLLNIATGVAIESMTLEDTGSAGGGGDRHMIYSAGAQDGAILHNLELLTPVGNGIFFTGAGIRQNILLDGIEIFRPAWGGIVATDVDTSALPCKMADVSVNNPGFGGSVTRAGIDTTGPWNITNYSCINLDASAPGKPTGVRFGERLAIDPDGQDGRKSTLIGFTISGTGANAVGIQHNGRQNSVVGGSIDLTGGSSVGVLIEGTLGQQQPEMNSISDTRIKAGVGYDEINTAGQYNMLSSCRFEACGTAIRLASKQGVIDGNLIVGSTVDAIEMTSTSSLYLVTDNKLQGNAGTAILIAGSQVVIDGNLIVDSTVDAIQLEASASNNTVTDNKLRDNAGNGIEAVSGSSNNEVFGNTVADQTGDDYLDAGTDNKFFGNFPRDESNALLVDPGPTVVGATELAVIEDVAIPAGDGGPDGIKKYIVNGYVVGSVSGIMTLKIRMGATGKIASDALVRDIVYTTAGGIDPDGSLCFAAIVTPAAGDEISIGAIGSGANTGRFEDDGFIEVKRYMT